MFDDSYIVDKVAEVWEEVFTDFALSPSYVYRYHNYRGQTKENTPSVLIKKSRGSTIVRDRETGRTEPNLLSHGLIRLWRRDLIITCDIVGFIKNEANPNLLYPSRLESMFLRKFVNGNQLDCGTDGMGSPIVLDAINDRKHAVFVNGISENISIVGSINTAKSGGVEDLEGVLLETLQLSMNVSFYEYQGLTSGGGSGTPTSP